MWTLSQFSSWLQVFKVNKLSVSLFIHLCFETHVFHSRELSSTRRWAIDSDRVAHLVEISSAVKVFTCHALLGFWLLSCWVQVKVRSLSFSDNDSALFGTCNQVKLSIYVHLFFPKAVFGFTLGEIVIYCCVTHDVMVQKASFRICPAHWPFKYDTTNEHFEQI